MTARAPASESPETQEIIELLLSLSENPARLSLLKEKAERRLEEMHQAEDSFFAGVDAEGPEFYQEYRLQVEDVEKEFHAYGDALEDILEEDFEPLEVARALAQASYGLRIGMARYDEAYLSKGPFRYPVINLFQNVAKAVDQESIDSSLWPATCDRYLNYYRSALQEVEKSPAAEKPGVPERKNALRNILIILEEMKAREKGGDLEALLARLNAAHMDLDRAFDLYHKHEFADSPTRAPKINWLIRAAEGVLNEIYQPGVLENLAQELLDVTQQNLAELRAMSRGKMESAVLAEELERMLDAVAEIEDALMFLLEYSQGVASTETQVREAIDDLKESGDALVESTRIVKEVHDRAGKVTCVQCQTVQEKGGRACVACGAMLPQLPEEGVYTHQSSSFQVLEGDPTDIDRDEVMTDVMHALFETCEAFMKGRKSIEELGSLLDKTLRDLDKAQNNLNRLQCPHLPDEVPVGEEEIAQNFVDLADDALILLGQGASECRHGLLTMRHGAELDDFELLRNGMRAYYEGVQKMWQVRRLERQFDNYLKAE